MSLTLSPAVNQIQYPEDFPDGRCAIEVHSEFPNQGLVAPLLQISVTQGDYLIVTDTSNTPKPAQEIGHTRQGDIRRSVATISIMLSPGDEDSIAQPGTIVFENGTDRVSVQITVSSTRPHTNPTPSPDTAPTPVTPPITDQPVTPGALLLSKSSLAFGNVAPQRSKTESFTIQAQPVKAGDSIPVHIVVEPAGVFSLGTENNDFVNQLRLQVGAEPATVVVRFTPESEGNFTSSLSVVFDGIVPQTMLLTGTGRLAKRPTWLLPLLAIALIGGLLWWLLQKPENPNKLQITGVSTTTIQLHYDTTAVGTATRIIERSDDSLSFSKTITLATGQVAVTDSGLQPHKKYWYRGLVKGRILNSEPTAVVDTTTLSVVPVPQPGKVKAPEALTAQAGTDKTVALHWRDAATNETGFEIQRSTDSVKFRTIHVVLANVNSFRDKNLAPGPYYYRVRAVGTQGKSDYSNTASATIASGPAPDEPVDPNKPEPKPTPPSSKTYPTGGLIMESVPQKELQKKQPKQPKQ